VIRVTISRVGRPLYVRIREGVPMISLHRPTLRDCTRAVAVGIVIVFAVCAVSIAYAAGRHANRDESSHQGRLPIASTEPVASHEGGHGATRRD
jgi:hypothetical protein